jgi:hypothetical protein
MCACAVCVCVLRGGESVRVLKCGKRFWPNLTEALVPRCLCIYTKLSADRGREGPKKTRRKNSVSVAAYYQPSKSRRREGFDDVTLQHSTGPPLLGQRHNVTDTGHRTADLLVQFTESPCGLYTHRH